MLLDSVILVYKVINDIIVYVVGNAAENELILQSVLQALDETVANLLKYEHAARTRGERDGRGRGGWAAGGVDAIRIRERRGWPCSSAAAAASTCRLVASAV